MNRTARQTLRRAGAQFAVRRLVGVAVLEVGVENIALERFAGLLDDVGDALEAQAERLGEDLIERVALNRIVGNFRCEGEAFPE